MSEWEAVWLTTAYGSGSVERVCDSLETGQAVCDDLLAVLHAEHEVVEDWANLNVPGTPPRWVRYVREKGSERVVEQSVSAREIDRSGKWFR